MIIRQVSHGTEINAGRLCIQREARSGQMRKHLRYSFKMQIPVAQPFGYDELFPPKWLFNILEQVICTCSDAFIVRIYVRWNHQCAYNDMNYHIASRGLFHGGHVGFTPSWTQRTDKIRLPSYSPYQKTYR